MTSRAARAARFVMLNSVIMYIKSILVVVLAALCCVPAMGQKKKKKSKKKAKTVLVQTAPTVKAVDGKTFSYALGVSQGQSLKDYLVRQMGVDSAYVKYAIEGLNATLSKDEFEKKKAYAAGLQISEVNRRNLGRFNHQACGKEDSAYVDVKEFERGLSQVVLGQSTAIKADSAMKVVEQQLRYQQESYKLANVAWLENNKKVSGVKTLPSGLQYSVITEGKGPVAADSTEVEVNYEGKLIDGTVFDSSYKRNQPATFRPSQVIKGWREALTLMPEGSVWNLYIPASLAYGERGQGQQIPANSTLIFKVEVLKVKGSTATSQPAPAKK